MSETPLIRCPGCGMRTSPSALTDALCPGCVERDPWPYGDGPRPYVQALHMATRILESLGPVVQRADLAGSLRRRCPQVGDLEIVSVPGNRDTLMVWAENQQDAGLLRWIKPGTSEVVPWEPKRDGKYWRAQLPCGMKLDLFFAEPGNFGLILAIRTGSAEFSKALVTHAKRIGNPSVKGWLTAASGHPIPTPTEPELFAFLGLEWTEPEERTGTEALRLASGGRAGA